MTTRTARRPRKPALSPSDAALAAQYEALILATLAAALRCLDLGAHRRWGRGIDEPNAEIDAANAVFTAATQAMDNFAMARRTELLRVHAHTGSSTSFIDRLDEIRPNWRA